uniref:Synaptic ras gtpase activating protein syngap n=1 Tax=Echinococcus granulosus TaxID=6210 RepID=A0A068WSU4_ECHGR|nr:synaptic ras gtpase activating protein syngap [Echinococcus granulosus]
MPKASSHGRGTSITASKSIVCQQTSTKTTTISANLIRARSSTIHANNSTFTTRSSTQLNHNESAMSSSLHITKTSTLLSPPSGENNSKSKTSPWFWQRKNTSRNSLVRSASANKANEGGAVGAGGWKNNRNCERPSGDKAYESETSTLGSTIANDGASATTRNQSIIRSASTRETKPTGGFLRFLRVSFSSRAKKPKDFGPGTPPLSMTQSGLGSLAERQASIAKVFADPNNRLSKHILRFPKDSETSNSVESFDSAASGESLSSSDGSQQPSIGLCYSNDKPPLRATRNTARSHSAHTRPPKCQPSQPTGREQRATNIYTNEVDAEVSMEIIRQPPVFSGINNRPQRVMHALITKQQPAETSSYDSNAYENTFHAVSGVCQPESIPVHYFQAYYPQSHFNSTYSDGQIYDQPPAPHPKEMRAPRNTRNSGNNSQYCNESLIPRMIPPVPPATAPASRRRFGRSNYESEEISGDEGDEEEDESGSGRGGTLSRKRPAPPMGVLTNRYSRESLNCKDAHEKTPVPRGNTPARATVPPHPLPNLPQSALKTRLTRRQTVGAIQTLAQTSSNPEPTQGSLHLKRVVRPDLEQERHRDTSLRITIHESKNLPSHRRYFCDICLDRKLYARTTSKLSKETVFWGECFDLNNLAELNFITINLYREAESTKDASKRRKSSKAQNQLIAFLTIAISDLSSKYETQQWHTMTPGSMLPSSENLHTNPISPRSSIRQSIGSFNNPDSPQCNPDTSTGCSAKRSISLVGPPPTTILTGRIRRLSKHNLGGSESRMNAGQNSDVSNGSGACSALLPQIRLAVKYQSIDVLPLHCYDNLRKLVVEKSAEFVRYLEPLLPTKRKEEIARCLVNIHEKTPESNIAAFLASLVDHELDTSDNLSLLFRSNSIGSKAVECYIKLVGVEYLRKLLQGFIENLLTSSEDLEVDATRLTTHSWSPASESGDVSAVTDADARILQRNRIALTTCVKTVLQRLQASLAYFPADLRETLASIRRTVEQRHGQEVGDQLVSGCLFLRYICPAIHGPTLFGLTNAVPDDPRVSRNLTLLAKVLQTIANFSHFEAKENYMRFLNSFVQSMQEEMHQFLRAVSTLDDDDDSSEIWKRQNTNVSNCHSNIDLGYELTVLYGHLSAILKEHPKVPDCLAELPDILAGIEHMLSKPSLRRSLSNLANSIRSGTSASLEDAVAIRNSAFRFHSTVTPPLLNELQIIPAEQPSTPVSFGIPGGDYTSKCASPGEEPRCSLEISSPSSEGVTRQQAFFGESFEPGAENSRGTDLESISETEVQTSSPVNKISTSPTTQLGTCTTANGGHYRSASVQRHKTPQTSASLHRCKEVEKCCTGNGGGTSTANTLPTPPQKWSSGPELHADSPVILNFPPPPPALPQLQNDKGLGGSSTNIRMGTRALRMSRERDLTGNIESGTSTRNGEDGRDDAQLSTVPVILQCETPVVTGARTATTVHGAVDKGGGDGSVLSVDSTASYESSTVSSSCLSIMPHGNNVNTVGANGRGQGVFVTENAHHFELPTNRSTSAVIQRGSRISCSNTNTTNSNNNDPALLSRVHRLLFGGGSGSGNDYQNVRGIVRPAPSTSSSMKFEEQREEKEVDPRKAESTQLEALQQRLRAIEEHLNQERRDMQKAVASNMRMMESQERCINECCHRQHKSSCPSTSNIDHGNEPPKRSSRINIVFAKATVVIELVVVISEISFNTERLSPVPQPQWYPLPLSVCLTTRLSVQVFFPDKGDPDLSS